MLGNFDQADAEYGTKLARMIQVDPEKVRTRVQASTGKQQSDINGAKSASK